MSIDRIVFADAMELLAERFNRPDLSERLLAMYLRFVEAHLSTDEFRIATRVIFERDKFWPEPQRFVDVVRGDPKAIEEEARHTWDAVLAVASTGGMPDDLPADALSIVRDLGGITLLGRMNAYDLNSARARFVRAYVRTQRPDLAALARPATAALGFDERRALEGEEHER